MFGGTCSQQLRRLGQSDNHLLGLHSVQPLLTYYLTHHILKSIQSLLGLGLVLCPIDADIFIKGKVEAFELSIGLLEGQPVHLDISSEVLQQNILFASIEVGPELKPLLVDSR